MHFAPAGSPGLPCMAMPNNSKWEGEREGRVRVLELFRLSSSRGLGEEVKEERGKGDGRSCEAEERRQTENEEKTRTRMDCLS